MKAARRFEWRILWAISIARNSDRVGTAVARRRTKLSPTPSINQQVDELVQDLNNPSFATRTGCESAIGIAWSAGIEPLATAAIQGNSEIVHRVLEILKRGSLQNDAATKNAAKQAIDRIATTW